MFELHVEVFSEVSEDGHCTVPLETIIILFIYEYLGETPTSITFVKFQKDARSQFNIKIPRYPHPLHRISYEDCLDLPGNLCKLPCLISKNSCIAGLCSVLRRLVKIVDDKHFLLGFKQGCLSACAESSVWTKFCEVDIIETVNKLFADDWDSLTHVPLDVARFESHMRQPVRAHNIQKQKQDLAREEGISIKKHSPDSRLDVIQDLEHSFSEGHKMTLADLILLPCFYIYFQFVGTESLRECIPLTYKWFDNLLKENKVCRSLGFILDITNALGDLMHVNYHLPDVQLTSLYKSECRVSRGKKQAFTKQDVVEKSLDRVKVIDVKVETATFGGNVEFDWSLLPKSLQLGHQFPEGRVKRKTEQLENMVKAVLKIAKPNDTIVDFCSGSGYLGLIIGHSLPLCTVILLENKEESMKRAEDQAEKCDLRNVYFCQSNIDYFRGGFDIGMSLHACGVATDLVLEKCIQNKASFVSCPCCYGSIQENHVLPYPRSEAFTATPLTIDDYMTLAHASDQTHDENNQKTSQGKRCMNVIDTDRCLYAREHGYTVCLSTLDPPTCTPKNNLLVGVAPS